jgi:hypothetical protein
MNITKTCFGISIAAQLGAVVVLSAQLLSKPGASDPLAASTGRRIFVPFMHMRNIGAGAGHEKKPGEDHIDAGTEVEIWNVDDSRPLIITEIYFTAADGKTVLEGSKQGLPLPLKLEPHTQYHFNSFYEYFKLPVPQITKERASYVHGYLADIRWEGPTPKVRTWDLGVKNGQYYSMMPGAVFQE